MNGEHVILSNANGSYTVTYGRNVKHYFNLDDLMIGLRILLEDGQPETSEPEPTFFFYI